MKHCVSCKQDLEDSQFYKRAASKDGLNRLCKVCDNTAKKSWRQDNTDKYKESNKKYHENNREKINKRSSEWRKDNREAYLEGMRNWRAKNSHKQAYHAMRYNASKVNATPSWLTEDQIKEMFDIYALMVDLNKKEGKNTYHVDHIVPLRGKNVCGLHVPWNLEVKTRHENITKGNRFECP